MNINLNKSFCVLPFMHLATHPVGIVTPCCITDMENNISTAKKDDNILFLGKDKLDDITNSELFNRVRLQMISGEYPEICKNCYRYESLFNRRAESNEKFKHIINECVENTKDDGSLKKIVYRYIELRLGTVCNLKCITCNPFSSSKWNEDVDIFKGTEFEFNYFKNNIKTEWYRNKDFYNELFERCQYLEEIWINGGEPTLIKEHSYFLDKLIESGKSKNINLQYTINMTIFPDNLIEMWKKFKSIKLQISIDDLGKRNDYIRTGSKWDITYNNLLKLLKYKDIFSIEVCQTVSMLNVYNLNNFKLFISELELINANNFVHYPSFMNIKNLPDIMKIQILDNVNNLTIYEIEKLKNELNNDFDYMEFEKFKKFIKMLDTKRKLSIVDYLPEWKEYFI